MSDKSGSESSEDEIEEGGKFVLRKRYTILMIDATVSMENGANGNLLEQVLKDIYTIFSELEEVDFLKKLNCGIIALGLTTAKSTEKCNVLLDLKSTDISALKNCIENKEYENGKETELPLKEGIEMAVDMFNKLTKKNDIKTLILITNNPKPKFKNEDEALTAARFLKMNMIEFLLLACDFKFSKFYELFFNQLQENMRELIQPDPSIFDTLCQQLAPEESRTKFEFYFDENNYFEMIQQKLFRAKYQSLRKVVKKDDGTLYRAKLEAGFEEYGGDVRMVTRLKVEDGGEREKPKPNTSNFVFMKSTLDRYCTIGSDEQKVYFREDELKEIEQKCNQPKKNALYLLYVGNEPVDQVISGDFKTRVIKPDKYKRNKKMFLHFWNYCVKNNKVLYCCLITKRRLTVILKPMLFKNKPCFIKYGIGFADNYRQLDLKTNCEDNFDESYAEDVMESIIMRLKTNKSFLDVRDPKLMFEEALLIAKKNQTEYKEPEDQLTMEYHRVDETIDELANEFLEQINS